ncbi:MAG: hypothetical protein AB7G11_03100 [Phycisphaerales bacterium]
MNEQHIEPVTPPHTHRSSGGEPGKAAPEPGVHEAAEQVLHASHIPQRATRDPEVVEAVEHEVMSVASPDGRAPDESSRRYGRVMFLSLGLGSLLIGAILIIVLVGGWYALAAASIYVFLLIVAGMPVWGAGILRRQEESDVHKEVVTEMRQMRRHAHNR